MKQKQTGFTIVELLIVIVVIGILAALTTSSFAGVQARARNSERVTDIKTVQTALEIYYAETGSYPRQGIFNGMDTDNWPVNNLKIPRDAIVAPQAPAGELNSFDQDNYGSNMDKNAYSYRAFLASNPDEACWDESDSYHVCGSYVLWYRDEVKNSPRTKTSLQGVVRPWFTVAE